MFKQNRIQFFERGGNNVSNFALGPAVIAHYRKSVPASHVAVYRAPGGKNQVFTTLEVEVKKTILLGWRRAINRRRI